ncbi:MAG: chorismate-binding protein [Bdellovibrionales bacterium]|nr:chorismate-binding protein [Bdellovibrionales bacterium]
MSKTTAHRGLGLDESQDPDLFGLGTSQSGILCPWFDSKIIVGCDLQSREERPEDGSWCFYAPDFFLEGARPWWNFKSVRVLERVQLKRPEGTGCAFDKAWKLSSKTGFMSIFEELKAALKKGDLQKAVPVVTAYQEGVITKDKLIHVLWEIVSLRGSRGELFPYGFWLEEEGMLGATPELLVSQRNGKISSMALAGTRGFGFTKGDLLLDSKERFEHQVVVDALVASLEDFGILELSETYEWDLGNLTHLRTDLELAVGQNHAFQCIELVDRIHPTPALGAWPKAKGLEWLRKNRPQEARRFGAPFGVRSPEGDFFFVVAIRNIQWHDGRTWLATGCGVTIESQAEREWAELALKRNFVLENLGL